MHMGADSVLLTFAREVHGIRLSAAYKLAGVLNTASNMNRKTLRADTLSITVIIVYTRSTTENSTAGLTMSPQLTLLMLV